MQYIPCNSALLAQEALFLHKNALFLPKDLQKKVCKSRQILIRVCSGLKFSSESKLFGVCHPCSRATSATLQEHDIKSHLCISSSATVILKAGQNDVWCSHNHRVVLKVFLSLLLYLGPGIFH